jgi:hypothetical protein
LLHLLITSPLRRLLERPQAPDRLCHRHLLHFPPLLDGADEGSKLRTMCGSRTGGWSLPCVMSD